MKLFKIFLTWIFLLTIKTVFAYNLPRNSSSELEECETLSHTSPYKNIENKQKLYFSIQNSLVKSCDPWLSPSVCTYNVHESAHKMNELHDELARKGSPFVKCILRVQDEHIKKREPY